MFFSTVDPVIAAKNDRDAFLGMSERDLLKHCRVEAFTGTGPGGQHRNRNYTAVRIVFLPLPEISAKESSCRSQKQNLDAALTKLRINIAVNWRKKAPEVADYRHLNENNMLYALELAKLLDVVKSCNFDHKLSALRLNISGSKLLKELARCSQVWQEFRTAREQLGLSELKIPGK